MTSASQSGQFHTGSTDRPAVDPSVFASMADSPASGVQAEESVTQSLADLAKGTSPESEIGPEAGEPGAPTSEELTVSELKDLLDEAGVEYPTSAHKADLIELAEENGLVEVEENGSEEDDVLVEAREKAQKADAERVELLRLEQQATEPADEKKAEAITKANEELQLAAHAPYLDALKRAEKKDAEAEKAKEAEAKKAEKAEEAVAKKPEEPAAKTADSKTAEKK